MNKVAALIRELIDVEAELRNAPASRASERLLKFERDSLWHDLRRELSNMQEHCSCGW